MARRADGGHSISKAKNELGMRGHRMASRMGNTTRDDEEMDVNEPQYYRERDDFDRRYVAYLFVDGSTDVRPLKGRITGNLVKKSAVCDSKRDAQERVAEWLEAQ